MVLESVAVTGVTGMLGRHLAAALVDAGFTLRAISRSEPDVRNGWDLSRWMSWEMLDEIFDGVDAIVHAAAAVPGARKSYDYGELFDVNVRASANLSEWANKRNLPLVYVSGAIVYPESDGMSFREDQVLYWSGQGGEYGKTKIIAEDILQRERQAGLRLAIVRPTSIYGHGLDATKTITRFLAQAGRGDPIDLEEPVTDAVDLIHAADVASAVVKILRRQSWITCNLGSGQMTSIKDLAENCISVAGHGEINVRGNAVTRKPILRFRVNSEVAHMQLEWLPRVSLKEGLNAVLNGKTIVV